MHSICSSRAILPPSGLRTRPKFAARGLRSLASPRRTFPVTRATKEDERKKVEALEESLKKSGLDRQRAQQVLAAWKQAVESSGGDGKGLTADDLRRVLVKQGGRVSLLVVIQILLDIGAAYGALLGGNFLGQAAEQGGGGLAVALQAIAYFISGYYATGALFDFFKLGMLLVATYQFNVNSAAFLTAVQELAGTSATGLGTVDKAVEAVNTVKVISGLNKMAEVLREKQGDAAGTSPGMLKDLAVYLTLEKAERLYGFDPAKYGITEEQAANIATVFTTYDADDNGVLSLDEFQRLCAQFAPELTAAEVKAGLEILDSNKDGQIQLGEFVEWWLKARK
ncbi:hypothetical protein ABPG77_008882 [Micractinium sp. CCAP 211/92]